MERPEGELREFLEVMIANVCAAIDVPRSAAEGTATLEGLRAREWPVYLEYCEGNRILPMEFGDWVEWHCAFFNVRVSG